MGDMTSDDTKKAESYCEAVLPDACYWKFLDFPGTFPRIFCYLKFEKF